MALDHQNLYDEEALRVEEKKELPDELLTQIAYKLIDIKDYICFGAVCKLWFSMFINEIQYHIPQQVPVLMFPDDDEDTQTRRFYSLTEKRLHHSRLQVPQNRIVINSSCGWLRKPCIGLAMRGAFNRLAYCKPGDTSWTHIDLSYTNIEDVTYYKNQFHIEGDYYSCDLKDLQHPKVSQLGKLPNVFWNGPIWNYIVESNGDLLVIARARKWAYDYDDQSYLTRQFFVFKLDPIELKWIEVNTLNGYMLFLGQNSSLSLLASDFPGCQPNCIYFVDDQNQTYVDHNIVYYGADPRQRKPEPHDMGVFNLVDGSFQPFYLEINKILPRPIWIEPTM
ncbi:hypothetical protein AQUCO_09400014v1 [Aquilegia coerulea]|uniref:KIB1-4 beta-propeller domain-containing protein n=1 Tax=Aquilegia coerulea TaxID=218851 RepID=A0A2G5C523_AQUCA|nr:hypothetical protein AQUCO_09400014v1 [Aquilegia coerulea]